MPYKSDKALIQGTKYDRRRKLTDDDKADIIKLSAELSIHQLAKNFGVSRRLVQFILYPERHEENLIRRKARGGSKMYYEKEANRLAVARLRHYKHNLYKKGLIK